MILHAFPPHTVETVPAWNGAPLRSWRWAIDVGSCYAALVEQVRFGERDWRSSHALRHYYLGLARSNWHVGMNHAYYDGPLHALWIGPLYLNWSPERCDVCMPEDTSGAVASFIGSVLLAAMGVSP